ncbi:MFS transporter [Cytobacillus sp. IB215316]|uniref:MFS transporter n=1 Tax=Cytobacillus sp. IB215316 TaxID=3097354 RepID=UPI002A12A117|nr:MFS transporter [Cytobacillus sp. IB215316]MDX8362570.1 MFS transporter [Cytobacillus sp. IB215316]
MFKNRNFLLLWSGQLVSIFGNRFSELVIPLIILHVTDSPLKAGVVAVSTHIAPLLFSIPAGVWIEQRSKKTVALVSELIRALTMFMLVATIFFGTFNLWFVSGILLMTGLAGVFFRISFNAMLPRVVQRQNLVDAHNYLEGADAVSTLVGPALAGIALTVIGGAWTLSIDAFSFLLSFIAIFFLVVKEPVEKAARNVSGKQKVNEGLQGVRFLFGNRLHRFITLNHTVLNFSSYAVVLLVIVYASQVLHLNDVQTGLLLSAAGLGNIFGVILMRKVKLVNWNMLYGSLILTSGIGVLLIVLSTSFVPAFIGMFIFDGALSMAFVINGAGRQKVTPTAYLARVSSAGLFISSLVAIVANLFAGGVAQFVNANLGLVICSMILVMNGLIAYNQRSLNKPVSAFEASNELI